MCFSSAALKLKLQRLKEQDLEETNMTNQLYSRLEWVGKLDSRAPLFLHAGPLGVWLMALLEQYLRVLDSDYQKMAAED